MARAISMVCSFDNFRNVPVVYTQLEQVESLSQRSLVLKRNHVCWGACKTATNKGFPICGPRGNTVRPTKSYIFYSIS